MSSFIDLQNAAQQRSTTRDLDELNHTGSIKNLIKKDIVNQLLSAYLIYRQNTNIYYPPESFVFTWTNISPPFLIYEFTWYGSKINNVKTVPVMFVCQLCFYAYSRELE